MIRRATADDVDSYLRVAGYSYSFPESYTDMARERFIDSYDEHYVVEEKERVVALARVLPLEQNVRGVWKKMGGVAMVASTPEHRRQGHVRDMIMKMMADIQRSDYAVSCLYPFKDSFYMRVGYVKMPPLGVLELNPSNIVNRSMPEGYSVMMVDPAEGKEPWTSVHSRVVTAAHGGVRRSQKRWDELTKYMKSKIAIAYGPDMTPEGVVVYGIRGYGEGYDWAETGRISVREILWSNLQARNALLTFLYLHADQVVKVSIPVDPRADDYYHWISGVHNPTLTSRIVHMSRVIDVQQAFEGIPVNEEGEVVLSVEDPCLTSNTGTYLFTGVGGKLSVTRSDKRPSAQVTIEGLTALLYGTLSLEQMASMGWLSGEVQGPLMDWLPRAVPWLTEDF